MLTEITSAQVSLHHPWKATVQYYSNGFPLKKLTHLLRSRAATAMFMIKEFR